MLTFHFTGVEGVMTEHERLTSGMVGKEVKLEFSSDWDNQTKTAVFMAGEVTRDVVDVTDVVTIPAEVLTIPMRRLYVGVYGVSKDGKRTPTIRVQGPNIEPGADPSNDEGTNPELPIWAQLQSEIDDLRENGIGGSTDSSQSGEDGGYYMPSVYQPDAKAIEIMFLASKGDMPPVKPTRVVLPVGPKGDDYILTDIDKTEIAELAAELVDTALLDTIGTGEVTV